MVDLASSSLLVKLGRLWTQPSNYRSKFLSIYKGNFLILSQYIIRKTVIDWFNYKVFARKLKELEFFKIKNIEREIKNENKKRSKRKQPPPHLSCSLSLLYMASSMKIANTPFEYIIKERKKERKIPSSILTTTRLRNSLLFFSSMYVLPFIFYNYDYCIANNFLAFL
jgi:hypothetical protein